ASAPIHALGIRTAARLVTASSVSKDTSNGSVQRNAMRKPSRTTARAVPANPYPNRMSSSAVVITGHDVSYLVLGRARTTSAPTRSGHRQSADVGDALHYVSAPSVRHRERADALPALAETFLCLLSL